MNYNSWHHQVLSTCISDHKIMPIAIEKKDDVKSLPESAWTGFSRKSSEHCISYSYISHLMKGTPCQTSITSLTCWITSNIRNMLVTSHNDISMLTSACVTQAKCMLRNVPKCLSTRQIIVEPNLVRLQTTAGHKHKYIWHFENACYWYLGAVFHMYMSKSWLTS